MRVEAVFGSDQAQGERYLLIPLYSYVGLKLIGLGDLVTPASWIREFITSHPAYKGDSAVSEEINYDLVKAVDEMLVSVSCRVFCRLF